MFKSHYLITNALFYYLAQSTKVLQSQWYDVMDCSGPPNAMYLFNMSSVTAYTPTEGETWAEFYTYLESPIGYCGNKDSELYDSCCSASIYPKKTNNWASGSPTIVDDNLSTYESVIFSGAAGQTYCSIQPIDGSLFKGFLDVMILGNDLCIDQYYKCSTDGEFKVYPNTTCTGEAIKYSLSTKPTNITDNTNGMFTGELRKYNSGTISQKWITYFPSSDLVPLNPNPNPNISWDYWSIIQMLISLSLYSIGFLFAVYQYVKVKKPFMVFWFMNQGYWMVLSILYLWNECKIYDQISEYNLHVAINNALYGLATLSSVSLTTYQLYSIKLAFIPRWTVIPVCVLLVSLHILFSGAVYTGYCNVPSFYDNEFCNSDFRQSWRSLNYWWVLVMFLWNIIPTTIIVYYIVFNMYDGERTIRNIVKQICALDLVFPIAMCFQVVLMITFVVYSSQISNNDFMTNDKQHLAMNGGKQFIRALHFNLNFLLLTRIPVIFKEMDSSIKSGYTSTYKSGNKVGTTTNKSAIPVNVFDQTNVDLALK
ncbi:hypothetical protein BC833DRAFT_658563 [Globomyces pollinis-pini]|nr:hypothetical protein BC833DRAFT_658563 [Globomyces pollinis-pini]